VQLLQKTVWRLLKKLKIEPLLGIYPKESKSGYDRATCTPMFTAALFTIAKLWKQLRCPTTVNGFRKCGMPGTSGSHL
jgi:hypothetical protein